MYAKTNTITHAQARLAAHDESQSDPHYLRLCASFLLSRFAASDDDIQNANVLIQRANELSP